MGDTHDPCPIYTSYLVSLPFPKASLLRRGLQKNIGPKLPTHLRVRVCTRMFPVVGRVPSQTFWVTTWWVKSWVRCLPSWTEWERKHHIVTWTQDLSWLVLGRDLTAV